MGRKKMSADDKRQGVYIKLPLWIKIWLRKKNRSQGAIIEEALIKAYELKESKKG